MQTINNFIRRMINKQMKSNPLKKLVNKCLTHSRAPMLGNVPKLCLKRGESPFTRAINGDADDKIIKKANKGKHECPLRKVSCYQHEMCTSQR